MFKCIRIKVFTLLCAEFASEPQTIPQWPDRQTSDGETKVGDGVQRLPGVCGRVYEHAGEQHPITQTCR